jgi:hypothetical protein
MAEWYEDVNNANEAKQYRCTCGCNMEFVDYQPGVDISIGNSWLITENAMVDYQWADYTWMNEFNLWRDLREDIIFNYNHSLNNEPIKPEDAPWIHLYNRYVVGNDHIPLNEKLYYEYVY